jgi:hypothetical protein
LLAQAVAGLSSSSQVLAEHVVHDEEPAAA